MPPSHVLVPLDGSPLADDALVHALETFDCRVTVLNVVTPVDASMSESGVLGAGEERRETAHDRAERLLTEARERADRRLDGTPGRDGPDTAQRPVETAVEAGDPAETILAFVDDHDVDHVIMGGHGGDRGTVARRLLGTVATSVVGEAPVTVTVVR